LNRKRRLHGNQTIVGKARYQNRAIFISCSRNLLHYFSNFQTCEAHIFFQDSNTPLLQTLLFTLSRKQQKPTPAQQQQQSNTHIMSPHFDHEMTTPRCSIATATATAAARDPHGQTKTCTSMSPPPLVVQRAREDEAWFQQQQQHFRVPIGSLLLPDLPDRPASPVSVACSSSHPQEAAGCCGDKQPVGIPLPKARLSQKKTRPSTGVSVLVHHPRMPLAAVTTTSIPFVPRLQELETSTTMTSGSLLPPMQPRRKIRLQPRSTARR